MTIRQNGSIAPFLGPTKLIESEHPEIIAAANDITSDAGSVVEQARALFYYIRDSIRYEFRAKFLEEQYRASYILQDGKGFCTQKAILFCALARSLDIPAGIYFYDIIDYSLPEHTIAFMKTRKLFHHGIAALYLNDDWRQLDATLDIHLMKRNKLRPVEFCPDRHCLMSETTMDGRRHIEYETDYGLVSDVTFAQVAAWFMKGYPHLVEKYSQQNKII